MLQVGKTPLQVSNLDFNPYNKENTMLEAELEVCTGWPDYLATNDCKYPVYKSINTKGN